MSNNNRFARILLRGGTREELKYINPMLREREPIVEYDTGRMKIGDGINRYNKLRYVGSSDIVPSITKFNITKCFAGDKWYNGNKIEESLTVTKIELEYEITSSPDRLIIKHGDKTILNEELPEKLKDTIEIVCDDISKNNNKPFKIQLEMLDKNPIEKSISVSFNPYMYYGTIEILDKDTSTKRINDFLKDKILNPKTSKSKMISSSDASNGIECYDIECGSGSNIFFMLPKSIYENTGIRFQDINARFGFGGFVQLTNNNIDNTKFSCLYKNNTNEPIEFSKENFIEVNNKYYYIYVSEELLTDTLAYEVFINS